LVESKENGETQPHHDTEAAVADGGSVHQCNHVGAAETTPIDDANPSLQLDDASSTALTTNQSNNVTSSSSVNVAVSLITKLEELR